MMLGVHRTGHTMAAGALQKAGVIHYARGVVTIRDRRDLEAHSCECYEVPAGNSSAYLTSDPPCERCAMCMQHQFYFARGIILPDYPLPSAVEDSVQTMNNDGLTESNDGAQRGPVPEGAQRARI
jgi:hypothetical protein